MELNGTDTDKSTEHMTVDACREGKPVSGTILAENISMEEKLRILSDAAKYDVACTSSGVDRKGNGKTMGSTVGCGICHSFTPDGRCVSLLKILFTNECIFDCKYCINRSSNDVPRATFTPDEICRLTIEFYRRNYIEGLFLSSGILRSPNYTMELMYETIYKLRKEWRFNGYVHVKAIPGADSILVENIGYLADRMSVNLEFPTADGLKKLAPHKNRKNILTPMKEIQTGIENNRHMNGIDNKYARMEIDDAKYLEESRNILEDRLGLNKYTLNGLESHIPHNEVDIGKKTSLTGGYVGTKSRYFVPAGQSTQMIVGATDESDYHIINVTEALYDNYDLKRVFYSAFINVNNDAGLPSTVNGAGLLREHRLYQADWLLRFYGFKAKELLSEDNPYFNDKIDPKCDWAVRHLEHFPVEINKADYYTLLRVPGIGVKSAKRIIAARRHGSLTFDDIKKMGVVLKRALYFITCKGRMMYQTKLEEKYITNHLIYNEPPHSMLAGGSSVTYTQMNISDFISCEDW